MKRTVLLLIAIMVGFGAFRIQEAKAMDPVTIAILAPIAIKAAQVAAPYVMRGLKSGGVHLLKMGKDVLEILYLPLGVVQCTLLAPFGQIGSGVQHIVKGGIAPFKLALDAVLLPISFFGVDFG
jgi:uncharacterized protein YceK